MVPVMIGLFGFTTKDSIAISSAIVFWSALLRFVLFSAYASHPERPDATEVDYNVVKAVFPVYLVGSYFGVILSVSLGELILVILMMFVLSALSVQVLLKAISLFKKESAALRAAEGDFVAANSAQQNEENKVQDGTKGEAGKNNIQTVGGPGGENTPLLADSSEGTEADRKELEHLLAKERNTCS